MSRRGEDALRRRVLIGQPVQARRIGQAVPTGTPGHRQPSSRSRGRSRALDRLDVEVAGRLRVVRARFDGEPVIVVTTAPSDPAKDDPARQARRYWQASLHTDAEGEEWT